MNNNRPRHERQDLRRAHEKEDSCSRSEDGLLLSFASYQRRAISASQLARAGFQYMPDSKALLCTLCGVQFSAELTEYVDASALHWAYSYGRCQHFQNLIIRARAIADGSHRNLASPTATAAHQSHSRQLSAEASPSAAHYLSAETPEPSAEAQVDQLSASTSTAAPDANTNLVVTVNSGTQSTQSLSTNLQPGNETSDYISTSHLNAEKCVQEVSMTPRDEPTNDLRLEKSRARTFSDGELPEKLTATSLAASGLYRIASQTAERVSCAFCTFTSRSLTEDIKARHMRSSPGCPQLRGFNLPTSQRNIPDVFSENFYGPRGTPGYDRELGIDEQQAKDPEMAVGSRRDLTYLSYPHPSHDVQAFSEAGYYYKGGEVVVCFWCGCESGNWTSGENPWKRHARTSPNCRFLILQKGRDFISTVNDELGAYRAPSTTDSAQERVTVRQIRPRMQTNWVQKALQMGLDRESVRIVIQNRIKDNKSDFNCVADIVREIQKLAKVQNSTPPNLPVLLEVTRTELPSESVQDVEMAEETMGAAESEPEAMEQGEGAVSALPAATAGQPQSDRAMSSEEAISLALQLKSQLTCKICMIEPVAITLLPCGHLVSCVSCSAPLVRCPLCRREIKGTVKVNL